MTTLTEKISEMIAQWHGCDATDRSRQQEKLVADLARLFQAEMVRQKAEAESPYCAFCVPRYLDGVMTGMAGGVRRIA